jgi:hypothetical protein
MPKLSRFPLRLRQRLLRGYEITMLGLLLTIAVAALAPSQPVGRAAPQPGELQCGKNQSSTEVIIR